MFVSWKHIIRFIMKQVKRLLYLLGEMGMEFFLSPCHATLNAAVWVSWGGGGGWTVTVGGNV